jgi:hypothetical protein
VLGNDRDRPVVADSHLLEPSAFRDGQRIGCRAQVVAAPAAFPGYAGSPTVSSASSIASTPVML